jgi:type IV secretion system protein VirD4
MSLAPFLFAAAATGRSILDVIEWIERDEHEEIQQILLSIDRGAAHAHSLSFAQPNEDRTAYLRLMREMLSVYEDPVVARSLDRHEIVTGELLDGGDHTLYVAVPEHDQARFRPLGATVIRQILAAAYEQAAATAGRLRPPLLVVLDEVVGLTTADDLTAVASAGAARGVQIVSVFQDVEQVEMAYGDSANRLIESHAAWLLLPNAHDADYGDDSGLAIPPDVARQLKDGEGALCYGATPPGRVRLRPWFRDRRLRRMAATPQDAVSPAERGDPATTFVAAEQVSAWHRRRPAEAPPDPTIPVDTDDPGFTDVFGSLDADSLPENVTRFPGSRPWFRR